MPNKLLVALDRLTWKTHSIAKDCKSFNGKCLGTLTFFVLCCTTVSHLGTEALKNIPAIKSVYYDTVVANFPGFVNFLSAPLGKILFAIIFVCIIFCYMLRMLHRPIALLIAHSTMGHNLSVLEKFLRKSFWFKRAYIEMQLPPHNATEEQVIAAALAQDKKLENLLKKNWCSTLFYYGVAHTPLVFRLGYQIGQIQRVRLLHRFRPTEDAQEFKELPEYEIDKMAFLLSDKFDQENYNSKNNQMLVSIATTYPIRTEDLTQIDPDMIMLRYDIQVDMMGFDFFNSYCKLRSYVDRITSDLRDHVKERGISTIHMVISSSVPFTFYLGQQMNTQQFCKTVIYHYDQGKYTWGIDVTEPNAEKAVVWSTDIVANQGTTKL